MLQSTSDDQTIDWLLQDCCIIDAMCIAAFFQILSNRFQKKRDRDLIMLLFVIFLILTRKIDLYGEVSPAEIFCSDQKPTDLNQSILEMTY